MLRYTIIAASLFALAMPAGATGPKLDPLALAAARGDAPEVARLLEAGADPNAQGWMGMAPLAIALRSCAVTEGVLTALIAEGADIEGRSGVGATPLMVAWQTGRPDLAHVLLDAGADPHATNRYGDTARDYAAYFGGALPAKTFTTLAYTSFGFTSRGAGARPPHCRE